MNFFEHPKLAIPEKVYQHHGWQVLYFLFFFYPSARAEHRHVKRDGGRVDYLAGGYRSAEIVEWFILVDGVGVLFLWWGMICYGLIVPDQNSDDISDASYKSMALMRSN
jgi:hypothetical protein